ncbi:MAG: hypothetical protein Q7S09_00415 [bacterium]|nr:hypothetical protein [bacterium]
MSPTIKKLILGFFLVSLGVLFWLFIKNLFFQDSANIAERFWSFNNIGLFVSLVTLYATVLGLVAFLINERAWAHGMLFAGILPYFLTASGRPLELVGAFAILWASLFVSREWIMKENANRISLGIEKSVPKNMSFVLTALALAVSTVFYVSPAVEQLKDIRIPRAFFQRIVSPFETMFERQVEFRAQSFTGTLEDAVPVGVVEQVKPEEAEILQRLSRPFTEPPSANSVYSEFTDALFNALNGQIARIDSLSPNVQHVVSVSFSLALFAIIRLLLIPASWIIIILLVVIFNVLVYTGFVKIGTVQVEKETIEL